MKSSKEILNNAMNNKVVVPAFNIPHLPMIEPIIGAISDLDAFSFIEVARLEWIKFHAKGPREIYEEFIKWNKPDNVRLHLDHVPVVDEDFIKVDYLSIIKTAIELGYHSVMVDGSRLTLKENISATSKAVKLAHDAGISCEAELGAVMGHEAGPISQYEELYESGKGFTKVEEAEKFVNETCCDWLSVAIGNIHGAVSDLLRDQKKPTARLNIEHLIQLRKVTNIPLVLHGGSGISKEFLQKAVINGICKVNVGTELRQKYESVLEQTNSILTAQKAVYKHTKMLISDYFCIAGMRKSLTDL